MFGNKEKDIFRDIAEFEKVDFSLAKPKTIVFLDDFIGTGGQAALFLEWYFEHYKWLEEEKVSIYLCVLLGLERV